MNELEKAVAEWQNARHELCQHFSKPPAEIDPDLSKKEKQALKAAEEVKLQEVATPMIVRLGNAEHALSQLAKGLIT